MMTITAHMDHTVARYIVKLHAHIKAATGNRAKIALHSIQSPYISIPQTHTQSHSLTPTSRAVVIAFPTNPIVN
jgi:hypothetical protein